MLQQCLSVSALLCLPEDTQKLSVSRAWGKAEKEGSDCLFLLFMPEQQLSHGDLESTCCSSFHTPNKNALEKLQCNCRLNPMKIHLNRQMSQSPSSDIGHLPAIQRSLPCVIFSLYSQVTILQGNENHSYFLENMQNKIPLSVALVVFMFSSLVAKVMIIFPRSR